MSIRMLGASSYKPQKMAPWPRHRPVHPIEPLVAVGATCLRGPGEESWPPRARYQPHAAPAEPVRPVHLARRAGNLVRTTNSEVSCAVADRPPGSERCQFASLSMIRTVQCDGKPSTRKVLQQTLVTSRHWKSTDGVHQKAKNTEPRARLTDRA
jgi:hypothetical protein